jgi:predicted secreted Zn-dependent protease
MATTGPVTGTVHVRRSEERYHLAGATAFELADDLRRHRPRDERFTGWTRWRLRWRIEPERRGGLCHPGPVDVHLEVTTVLPEWEAPPDASPLLRSQWATYIDALADHEAGHADLAETTADRIRDGIAALAPHVSCTALRALAHAYGRAEVDLLRNRNRDFDEDTGHGATQGAIFPGGEALAMDHAGPRR